MEFKIRLTLLAIGAVVILIILWDGLRRQKRQKKAIEMRHVNRMVDREPLVEEDILPDDEFERSEEEFEPIETQALPEAQPIEAEPEEELVTAEMEEVVEGEIEVFQPVEVRSSVEAIEEVEAPMDAFDEPEEKIIEPAEEIIEPVQQQQPAARKADRLIMFTLIAPEDKPFAGFGLLRALMAVGFRFGEMNLFHCHENDKEDGQKLFSIAAATKTGEFDISNMARFNCKGLILFMNTQHHDDPVVIFEEMIEVALDLSEELNAELKIDQDQEWSEEALDDLRDLIES